MNDYKSNVDKQVRVEGSSTYVETCLGTVHKKLSIALLWCVKLRKFVRITSRIVALHCCKQKI